MTDAKQGETISSAEATGNGRRLLSTEIGPEQSEGCFGLVEEFREELVLGWVVDAARPAEPLSVVVKHGDFTVGCAYTIRLREDVSRIAGRPLKCGFELKWRRCKLPPGYKELPDEAPFGLRFFVEGTDLELPQPSSRTPTAGQVREWVGAPQPEPMSGSERKAVVDSFSAPDIQPEVSGEVRAIAYYLPQFHPIPENDDWWGPGFTEWTNVSQGKPQFPGHYQPQIPGELGYYDLRLPDVREAQARLAREHGIHGFCYYYYWFAGRRILERPLQEVLESGKPDFPFCICWANESWSRRWDGSEHEVLLKQEHSMENDIKFIHDVIPILKDPRYIRVNGAPLLMVYRVGLFPDAARTAEVWRKICADEGIERIHLCAVESFGFKDPYSIGFDSSAEFPPHNRVIQNINKDIEDLSEDFVGNIYDYELLVGEELVTELPPHKRFPGVMVGWDNSPRRKERGHIFVNSTPENYEIWLRAAADCARQQLEPGERFLFINAWNEWAEGAHLEPDRKNGRAFLEATRRALGGTSDWRVLLEYGRRKGALSGDAMQDWIGQLEARLNAHDRALRFMTRLHRANSNLLMNRTIFSAQRPRVIEQFPCSLGGEGFIETINGRSAQGGALLDRRRAAYIEGWSFVKGATLEAHTVTHLFVEGLRDKRRYFAPVFARSTRDDVAKTFPDVPETAMKYCGFKLYADMSEVEPGEYHLGIFQTSAGVNFERFFGTVVRIG